MKHSRSVVFLSSLALFGLSAPSCGKAQSGASNPPVSGGSSASHTEPGDPDTPWEHKSFEEKREYMGVYVFPKMKTLFQEYDSTEYANFGCATCHGENGKELGYKMPNDLVGFAMLNPIEDAMGYSEETTEFMQGKVAPAMAELLGKPLGAKPGEFSCFNCHQGE